MFQSTAVRATRCASCPHLVGRGRFWLPLLHARLMGNFCSSMSFPNSHLPWFVARPQGVPLFPPMLESGSLPSGNGWGAEVADGRWQCHWPHASFPLFFFPARPVAPAVADEGCFGELNAGPRHLHEPRIHVPHVHTRLVGSGRRSPWTGVVEQDFMPPSFAWRVFSRSSFHTNTHPP